MTEVQGGSHELVRTFQYAELRQQSGEFEDPSESCLKWRRRDVEPVTRRLDRAEAAIEAEASLANIAGEVVLAIETAERVA
jgi:hypothetical protein